MDTETLALGAWVETHTETGRGGKPFTVAVNRLTSSAILLDEGIPTAELRSALSEGGFLESATSPVPAPRVGPVRRFLRTFDVHWTGADRCVAAIHRRLLWRFWRPRWIVCQVVIAVAGLVAVAAALRSGRMFELRPSGGHALLYVVISLVSIAIHELGHAAVLAHNDRRVAAVGFRLHLGSPAFYVESVEALLLSRRQRLLQAAAGPWAEWLFVSVVAIALWTIPGLILAPVIYRFVVLGGFTIVTNLLPFSGLDGSLLLGDLIGEPNLAADSKDALRRVLHDRRRGDGLLVGYAVLNTIVSMALLVTSFGLWCLVFGRAVAVLADHGVIGWFGAVLVLAVSFGPVLGAAGGQLRTVAVVDRVLFRFERRVRVRFTERLATIAPFDRLEEGSLGVLAGQLELRRVGRGNPLHAPAFRGYVAVDGDVILGGDTSSVASGIHVVDGAGVTLATRRWFGSVRSALVPEHSVHLLGLAPERPAR